MGEVLFSGVSMWFIDGMKNSSTCMLYIYAGFAVKDGALCHNSTTVQGRLRLEAVLLILSIAVMCAF